MKNTILGAVAISICTFGLAQQVPTISNPPNGGSGSNLYWSRAGNDGTGPQNQNNIFGTKWNSPIYFITGGLTQATYRMRLNGTFTNPNQYGINGFSFATGVNTSGYLGLGTNLGNIWSQNPVGGAQGPFSLLHLNGPNGTFVQMFGYRPWMKTGITFTDNQDLSYIGLRQVGTGFDITETSFAWSDNSSNASGPDDVIFRFTGGNAADGAGTVSNAFNSTVDADGRHVLRLTGEGHMALGNTFGINVAGAAPGYVRPQSHFHMTHNAYSPADIQWGFMQITYRDLTGETGNDGLRFGIDQQFNTANGYLRWQENSPFIVQSDWNTTAGGVTAGERMRILSIASPGVPQPASVLDNNITRVAISHHGSEPITAPRSLLHLGYNTSTNLLGIMVNDGWRNWMDVGTFTNIGSDNMYVGMKAEGNDRYDAVINWGDNQVPGVNPNGPDYLRFIFTSTTTALPPGTGDAESVSNEGLDIARMDPRKATTMPTNNYGMVGIGDWETPGNAPIDAKLDIDGDLRIRTVTQDSTLTRFLVIDPNDQNRVHYADLTIPSGGGYALCSDSASLTDLSGDGKMGLNNNNFYFEGMGVSNNKVGVGFPCSNGLIGKLSVRESSGFGIGVYSEVSSTGGNIAGLFRVNSGTSNTAVQGNAVSGNLAIGGTFSGAGAATNYGVYASAPFGASDYAGYFNGNVFVTGDVVTTVQTYPSDSQFKTDVNDLTGATALLNQLAPRTYFLDTVNYPEFRFETDSQMGLIAQEVELVIPSIVGESVRPATYDSLGTEIVPALTFKDIEYSELIPLLIAGFNEQSARVDSLTASNDSLEAVVTNLNDRLTQLENCLSNILPSLCNANNNAIQQTPEQTQQELRAILDVQLRDGSSIVLNQNVPNPFAEKTVITYSIPATVGKAQIHFYNGLGELINTVEIDERGEGQLNVFANDLSSGVYTYSLVADGKVVSTKRMVKQ